MFSGELVAIYVCARKRDEPRPVSEVEAVAGRGLVGDRYFRAGDGAPADHDPAREVTLIESEALDGLTREYEVALAPNHARRNLLTRNVPLNHLVGRTFRIGGVLLRGIRLCEPCAHLESLTVQGVKKGLCHRGGLRAQIVQGGTLHAGDAITPAPGT
jgi:MOSC domain-containing protein YiiM